MNMLHNCNKKPSQPHPFSPQVSILHILGSTDRVQKVFQPVCCFVQNLPANPCQQKNYDLSKFHLLLPESRGNPLINTPALRVFPFPCRAQRVLVTWVSGALRSAGVKVGLQLKLLFQHGWFYDFKLNPSSPLQFQLHAVSTSSSRPPTWAHGPYQFQLGALQ